MESTQPAASDGRARSESRVRVWGPGPLVSWPAAIMMRSWNYETLITVIIESRRLH